MTYKIKTPLDPSARLGPQDDPGFYSYAAVMHSGHMRVVATAKMRCEENSSYELTESEKFAIAVCSGVRVTGVDHKLSPEGASTELRTELCDVYWNGDKFVVVRPQWSK